MRHDWEDVSARTVAGVCKYGWNRRRRCKLCGAVQSHQDEQSWLRIVRRRWLPLVGRCTGKKKEKQVKKQQHKQPALAVRLGHETMNQLHELQRVLASERGVGSVSMAETLRLAISELYKRKAKNAQRDKPLIDVPEEGS